MLPNASPSYGTDVELWDPSFHVSTEKITLLEFLISMYEGDESQFNSLSPSNIDIKNSRRVTFSVNPGNEVAQSSTSMPSEVEALGNVVDDEDTINQVIDKHQ